MVGARIGVWFIASSNKDFSSLVGRYACLCFTEDDTIRLFDGRYWVELGLVDIEDIEKVKNIAIRDRGSLYVNIKKDRVGYILNEPIKE